MVVRKVIRNGQPDEATEPGAKKEVGKPVEAKTPVKASDQAEGEQEKKEAVPPKPVVKHRVRSRVHDRKCLEFYS